MKTYRTTEISSLIGVHPNTVRFYEEQSLLQEVPHLENGYRVYSEPHLYLAPFHAILLIDVATAVIGLLILSMVTIAHQNSDTPAERGSFFAEMKEGITYAANDRLVKRLLLTFGAFIFLCVPSGFLAVLMIERTFGDSYIYLTVNEMAGFAGMVLGGLVLGAWGGFKNRWMTRALGLTCYGIFSFAIGFTDTFWLFAVLMFLVSFFIPVVNPPQPPCCKSMCQRKSWAGFLACWVPCTVDSCHWEW